MKMVGGAELKHVQKFENTRKLLLGIGLCVLSLALWALSYLVVVYAVQWPAQRYEMHWLTHLAPSIAGVVIIILIVEGWLYKKKVLDGGASLWNAAATQQALAGVKVEPPGLFFRMIVNIPFSAPRTAVYAMKMFAYRTAESDEGLSRAAVLMNEIAAKNKWLPIEDFVERRPEMDLLLKMGMAQTRKDGVLVDVRLDDGVEAKYYGRG
jgi:hypothetical protein